MKRWMFNLLIVIFAGVFLVSAGVLGKYLWDSHAQKQQQNALSQLVDRTQTQRPVPTEPQQSGQEGATVPAETVNPYEEVTDPDTGETRLVLRDYAELYRVNNHLVGWLQIPGTDIDYPVMQTPDSADYYLHRDFYRDYSRHGTVYVRESCDVFTPSDNVTVYGHRMKDGSMFAGLEAYTDKEFFQEHRYIYFDTLTEYHTYEILAVFITTATAGQGFRYHTFENADSKADFDKYVNTCKSLSLYYTGVTANYGDKLITLSTCDYTVTNGRLVVVAKRIA